MQKKKRDAQQPSRVPTSFRIDPELLRQVQHECIDRRLSQTEAMEQGLEWWLAHGEGSGTDSSTGQVVSGQPTDKLGDTNSEGSVTRQENSVVQSSRDTARYHAMLEEILTSGHRVISAAIRSNLVVFSQTVRMLGKGSIGGQDTSDEQTSGVTRDFADADRSVEHADGINEAVQRFRRGSEANVAASEDDNQAAESALNEHEQDKPQDIRHERGRKRSGST